MASVSLGLGLGLGLFWEAGLTTGFWYTQAIRMESKVSQIQTCILLCLPLEWTSMKIFHSPAYPRHPI